MKDYCIINSDALEGLKTLPDECIQTCITSPPYYSLRDYDCEGQIGAEETPNMFIDRLVEVFREVRRVLSPTGTLWVNIGDCYAGSSKGRNKDGKHIKSPGKHRKGQLSGNVKRTNLSEDLKRKDLIGIPWMLAFALRNDGWYLRQDIIWQKPNAMPESVKDRCVKSHEYIFLLSKTPRYYFDYKAIQEKSIGTNFLPPAGGTGTLSPNARSRGVTANTCIEGELMRNKRSVWTVATHKSREHIATFPEKLIEPCILAGSAPGDLVLDPFCGSGTTGLAANNLGRKFIGIDLNPNYCELSKSRLRENANNKMLSKQAC